jgi:hypothetical protein
MGHKISPEIFRLGISVDWNYQLRDPLLANVVVYKTIKNLFWKYSAPYVYNTISKKKKPTKFNLVNRRTSLIRNHFAKKGFVFSHLNISYAPSLHLSIVLFDTVAERLRVEKELREIPSYYLSGEYLNPRGRSYSYFLKNIFIERRKNPFRRKYATRWFYYKRMLRRIYKRTRGLIEWFKYRKHISKKRKIRRRIYSGYRIRFKKIMLIPRRKKAYPLWLLNNSWIFSKRYRISSFIVNLRICMFLLRYFKFYKQIYSKKKLFLFNILIITLASVISFHQEYNRHTRRLIRKYKRISNILSRRIFIFMYLCHIHLLSFNYLQLQYNKQVLLKHLHIFHLFSKILSFTFRKAIFIPNDNRLIIRYYIMNNLNLNSSFLLNYFIIKLGQYFQLNDILIPIVRRLKRLTELEGFRLIFTGRLTRKERAAYIVRSHKSMPLASYKAKVDYASGFIIMKFGVVGIKIYLLYSGNIPYHYFYEFRTYL